VAFVRALATVVPIQVGGVCAGPLVVATISHSDIDADSSVHTRR